VRPPTKKSSSKAIQLREWRVTLIRNRGDFLGYVKAASIEVAETVAAKQFGLSAFQASGCCYAAALKEKAVQCELSG
jgi:hypothetical protein